jgi:hypothetical protein
MTRAKTVRLPRASVNAGIAPAKESRKGADAQKARCLPALWHERAVSFSYA